MKNREYAEHIGKADEWDAAMEKARAEFPLLDWDKLTLYHAQILCRDMPEFPSKSEVEFYLSLIGEPSSLAAAAAGRFDETCAIPVPKDTDRICLLPSVCYFMDGKIRRGVQLTCAYAMLSGIKLARLAGGDPRLSLASPESQADLTLDEAFDGLSRQMHMQVGDGARLPTAAVVGPTWEDSEVRARIERKVGAE